MVQDSASKNEIFVNDLLEYMQAQKGRPKKSRALANVFWMLIALFLLIAVIISAMWLPVFQICGDSMNPTLKAGGIAVSFKNTDFERGDVIAFEYNSEILMKRIIAKGGDIVDISDDGTVEVNGNILNEPYLQEKSLGACTISFPYTVPAGEFFVLGDNRSESKDSRVDVIGSIRTNQVIGKISLCVWPPNEFGIVR